MFKVEIDFDTLVICLKALKARKAIFESEKTEYELENDSEYKHLCMIFEKLKSHI